MGTETDPPEQAGAVLFGQGVRNALHLRSKVLYYII